jgi:hypothetical protein
MIDETSQWGIESISEQTIKWLIEQVNDW